MLSGLTQEVSTLKSKVNSIDLKEATNKSVPLSQLDSEDAASYFNDLNENLQESGNQSVPLKNFSSKSATSDLNDLVQNLNEKENEGTRFCFLLST